MRVAAIIVILGWSGAQSAATAQTLSFADARKAVVGERSQLWKDPESIRTASISAPQPCPFLPDDTCVCVETSIQNLSGGGRAEISKTRLYFSGSKIVDAIGPLRDAEVAQCGSFVPFPELNGGK
jgi:hypothetical protein